MNLSEIELGSIISRLRRSLLLPYSLVIGATIAVCFLIVYSAHSINAYSNLEATTLFNNVYNKELEDLGKLNKDYSYWNDMVQNLILTPKPEFIRENFLGPYLEDSFNVSRIIILNPDLTLHMSIHNGEVITSPLPDEIGADIQNLAQLALSSDMTNPTPATGTLWIGDAIYLVSVGAITPTETNNEMDINTIYGVLIMAKTLGPDLLTEWETGFKFHALEMHTKPIPPDENLLSQTIKSPQDRWIAEVSWVSDRPGNRFLSQVIPWVAILSLLIIAVSIFFVIRVQLYTKKTAKALVELHKNRQQLNTLAYYDSVTNLPNRSLFLDRLGQAVAANQRLGTLTGVLYIDLDGFKQVNDTRGHDVGDMLLSMVGQRMLHCTREEDTVSRLGGDEFCILIKDMSVITDIESIASKLIRELRKPFLIGGEESFISASIGIVVSPNDGNDRIDLLKKADIAMYQAKENGRNHYRYYTRELTEMVEHQAVLQHQLRNAQQNNEFSLVYQPVISASSQSIVGAEALLRWDNIKLGSVPPNEFISQAEQSGTIISIGEWVLNQVFSDAVDFYQKYGEDFFISINISGRQLSDRNFLDLVKRLNTAKTENKTRAHFHLEITESYLISGNKDLKNTLKELNNIGFSISLDDFGTGYSSLSYISNYPINTLKIDRSFMSNFTNQEKERNLIKAIVDMSKSLNLTVIAEGVENEPQLKFLVDQGCDLIQGYYLGRPVPKQEFLAQELHIEYQELVS